MVIASFSLVALDCPDPRSLAEFYRGVLGGEIDGSQEAHGWVSLALKDSSDIGFQRAEEYQRPQWPDGEPQQAHLDFTVADLDEGERAVLEMGATKADVQPMPDQWRVFLDPAGHPFCLCRAGE